VLRERYPQAVEIGPEQLGELQTLADIVTLIAGAAPAEAAAAEPPATAPAPPAGPPAVLPADVLPADLPAVPAEVAPVVRRYPALALLPAVDRQTAVYGAEPIAILVDDGGGLCPPLADALAAEGWQIAVLRLPGATPRSYPYRVFDLSSWDEEELADAEAALTGVTQVELCVYVAAHEPENWAEATDRLAHTVMLAKHIEPLLTAAAGPARAAFVVVTKLDGAERPGGAANPAALLGGLHGLVKTFAIEAPHLFCRAVDVAHGLDDTAAAGLVVDELYDVAVEPVAVALDGTARHTVDLVDRMPPPAATPAELTPADLLVVTGGGRGVTARCLQALARQTPCRLVLLGRTTLAEEPEWAVLATGETAVKAAAADHLRQAGEKPTPREVDRLTRDLLGRREVLATLADLREAGAEVDYLAVDITDAPATAAALAPFADQITGIVHGAGILADRMIAAKTPDEVRRVLAAKIDGLQHVLAGVDPARLRHLVLFSSVAGYFGNEGQVDYAIANSALNALAVDWKGRHPACHVTAINWGAWAGGMVTPQLQALFAQRGVGLIPLDVGAGMFAEQFSGDHRSDVVVVVAPLTPLSARTVRPAGDEVVVIERNLAGLDAEPAIRDHRLGGVPVLPTTVGLGWCINALERLYPGRSVSGVADFTVFKGVTFGNGDPGRYQLQVTPLAPYDGSAAGVVVQSRGGAVGISPRYGGTFALTGAPAAGPVLDLGPLPAGDSCGPSPYAEGALFHGAALQGIGRVVAQDGTRLVAECRLDHAELALGAFDGHHYDPVLSDLLLQAPLVWVRRFRDSACLPVSIGRVEIYDRPAAGATFLVVVDQIVTAGPIVTCSVAACAPGGKVHLRFRDVSVALSQTLSEKFEQQGRSDVGD
jgi:NAD(P)-dependent dehydrogenase (short-subunit alcohol dehydrogenase family)